MILGIDEAGRGCVLGDLFIGAFLISEDRVDDLRRAGVTDSKRLSPKRRASVHEAIQGIGTARVLRISPARIDSGNLNTLEEEAICQLIRDARPDRIILDALGPPAGFSAVLRRLSANIGDLRPAWTMEPKADLHHPPCGAASIIAKVARDQALAEIRSQWGELGSGYPSDPKTRSWLTAHARTGAPWPPFVRTRWGTIRQIQDQIS